MKVSEQEVEALGNLIFRIEVNNSYLSRHIPKEDTAALEACRSINQDLEALKRLKGRLLYDG